MTVEIDPYLYHACGYHESIPDIKNFNIFKKAEDIKWDTSKVNIFIIGQSHYINFDFGFTDICSCVPFTTDLHIETFSIEKEKEYRLPQFIKEKTKECIKIEVRGKVVAGLSDLDDHQSLKVFSHTFTKDSITKIVLMPPQKQNHTRQLCYKTLHTYPEYNRSLETQTEIFLS